MGNKISNKDTYDVITSIDINMNNPNQLFEFVLNDHKIGKMTIDKDRFINVKIKIDGYDFLFEDSTHEQKDGIIYVHMYNKKNIATLFIEQYNIYNYNVKFKYVPISWIYSGNENTIDILMYGPTII